MELREAQPRDSRVRHSRDTAEGQLVWLRAVVRYALFTPPLTSFRLMRHTHSLMNVASTQPVVQSHHTSFSDTPHTDSSHRRESQINK